jgi:hypothetical protein
MKPSKQPVILRRKRKIIKHELNTDNTPFPGLPRDLCELLLDLFDTASVFNLMLVSKNTKSIAYSETHWKKRLALLFDPIRIQAHLILTRGYESIVVPYRMINKPRTVANVTHYVNSELVYPVEVTEDGLKTINYTINQYIRHLSLQPLSEFVEILNREMPQRITLGYMYFNLIDSIMKEFEETKSRFAIFPAILRIMAIMHEQDNNIALPRGTIHRPVNMIAMGHRPTDKPLVAFILNQSTVVGYLRRIMAMISQAFTSNKLTILAKADPVIYTTEKVKELMLDPPKELRCPFVDFLVKRIEDKLREV